MVECLHVGLILLGNLILNIKFPNSINPPDMQALDHPTNVETSARLCSNHPPLSSMAASSQSAPKTRTREVRGEVECSVDPRKRCVQHATPHRGGDQVFDSRRVIEMHWRLRCPVRSASRSSEPLDGDVRTSSHPIFTGPRVWRADCSAVGDLGASTTARFLLG